MEKPRTAQINRKTKETDISLLLTLEGQGRCQADTGIPFMDHMFNLFARHGLFDVVLRAKGDVEVDYHHTVEDIGIVLGSAVNEALGDKLGICRYGFFLMPMDETLARVVIDLGGRPALVYRVESRERLVRDFNIGLVREFFQAFANSAKANVHIELEYGDEPHHIAEAIFKGFARALDQASSIDPRQSGQLPSTKGTLD